MPRFSHLTNGIGRFFSQFGAARSCAAALESGRRPSERALRTLGLDASLFERR